MDHSTRDFLVLLEDSWAILELDPDPPAKKKKHRDTMEVVISAELLKVSPDVRDLLEV